MPTTIPFGTFGAAYGIGGPRATSTGTGAPGFNINPAPQPGSGAYGAVPGPLSPLPGYSATFTPAGAPQSAGTTLLGAPHTAATPNPYADLSAIYPNLGGTNAQISANISSELQGNVPRDVINQMARIAAERGIGGGMGADAPNTNAAYLSALGKTSIDMQALGAKQYSDVLPVISSTQTVSPAVQAQIAEYNASSANAVAAANAAAQNQIGMFNTSAANQFALQNNSLQNQMNQFNAQLSQQGGMANLDVANRNAIMAAAPNPSQAAAANLYQQLAGFGAGRAGAGAGGGGGNQFGGFPTVPAYNPQVAAPYQNPATAGFPSRNAPGWTDPGQSTGLWGQPDLASILGPQNPNWSADANYGEAPLDYSDLYSDDGAYIGG